MRFFSLITSSFLASTTVLAKPVTVKDWTLDDTGAVCVAATNRVLNGQTYRLELSFDKSGALPVEVWLRDDGGTRAFRSTTEVKPIQSFAFGALKDAAGNVVFWQIPSDTTSFISYLKRQTRLLVQALAGDGTAKTVDFSLRGSSSVIDALISQCNQERPITQKEFEQAFVPASVATLDPMKLDEARTAELRGHYLGALVADGRKLALQKELTALNSRYTKQIQELAQVTGALDQLTQKELIALQNQKSALEGRIQSLDQQIIAQQDAIKAKETEVAGANAVYDRAWQILAPLEPEHKRLAEAQQSARNDLSRAQSRLNEIDASIQRRNDDISRAESELSSARSQVTQAESQLRGLRSAMDDAEFVFRRYDTRREYDDRVFENPVSRYCRTERADVCGSALREIENNADSEVRRIRDRLSGNVDAARNDYSRKNDEISRLQSRIRDIGANQLPSLRRQLSDLRSQRPSADVAVTQTRDAVAARTADLQSYDARVGYAEKKAAVDAASSVVVRLQGDLTKLEQAKSALIKDRGQQAATLEATDKKIEAVLAKIRETQDRSSQLSQALAPYFTEKARIEGVVAQTLTAIETAKREFARVIATL